MIDVVLLSSAGCNLCEDAKTSLAALEAEFSIAVHEVDMASLEGRELLSRHRPSMPPAVLVDGELFSVGRLPRMKLQRFLEARAA